MTRSGQPRKLPAALAAQAQAQGRAYSPTGAKGPADYGFGQLGKVRGWYWQLRRHALGSSRGMLALGSCFSNVRHVHARLYNP